MRRIACAERPDWRDKAEATGFVFHSSEGEPYWDERAYYAFSLEQIERDIEAATGELDAMCRELVARVVSDEQLLRKLHIPVRYWNYIAASFKRGDASLYGRFDFQYDGKGPAKLLEYNADTPTAVFETAVFQWNWLEDAMARNAIPSGSDQYNSLHEKLIDGWRRIGGTGKHLHLTGTLENPEDAGTLAYLEDTARQAGFATTVLDITAIGRTAIGNFVDAKDRPVELAFKLYPWEWLFREKFGASLPGASTRWIEPPWKAILSNKGILPLMWQMFPNHPNLLAAAFDDDPGAVKLGTSYVRKPLYSREGANVSLVIDGQTREQEQGPYGSEGFIRQVFAPLAQFDGNHAVVGSWIAGGTPCGLSVREDMAPITNNRSRFVPHAIIG